MAPTPHLLSQSPLKSQVFIDQKTIEELEDQEIDLNASPTPNAQTSIHFRLVGSYRLH